MKLVYEHIGYNGKGFAVRLLSKKEAYKRIDRIRLEFIDLKHNKKDFYDMQLFEAASIISGLSNAIFLLDIEKRKVKR